MAKMQPNSIVQVVTNDGSTIGVVLKDDATGEAVKINASGELQVVQSGIVDTNNTTTTPLGAGETFTGIGVEVLDYANACVNVHSDQDSAVDGLTIEKSIDGVDWVYIDLMSIQADAAKEFSYGLTSKFLRVTYTNGPTPQAHFDLSVVLKKTNQKPSSHRIQDMIVDEDDAELVKSVITGKTPSGDFLNANVTNDGDLSVSDNSSGLAIAEGLVSGKTPVHKWGSAPDFDTGDLEVTVWDGADDGTAWELMRYAYSTTADIDTISSSSALDTTETVIQGLDGDLLPISETVTLNGQTKVPLVNTYKRVFRAYNDNGTEFVGHVIIYVDTSISGGVPTDKTKIRLVIQPENQQTEMAIYTVPAGKTAYVRAIDASTSGASKNSDYIIRFYKREDSKVFRLQDKFSISDLATSSRQKTYVEPLKFVEKTDLEITVQSLASPSVTGASVSAGFDLVLVDN